MARIQPIPDRAAIPAEVLYSGGGRPGIAAGYVPPRSRRAEAWFWILSLLLMGFLGGIAATMLCLGVLL